MKFEKIIASETKKIKLKITPEMLNVFKVYKNLLQQWNNTRFNLTSILDDDEIAIKHFIDSFHLVQAMPIKGNEKLIDVGTGAGFPGLPIKIVFPSLNLTLVDSQKKKVFFIGMLLRRLGIEDVTLINSRGEKLGKEKEFRKKFDIVTMREVSKIAVISEIALPLLKIGGNAIFWKGGKEIEQIEKCVPFIEKLGGHIKNIKEYQLPHTSHKSYLICIEKVKETPQKYPRSYSSILKSLKKNAGKR
ncbi:MAG: 16S rRNA (guanine(527)-N(7))-methyltransferase RsmG [Caldisericaceae bacterium]|nr:16S rRNA (guanine(527)-N(7))-methyltransferase RsmG [Caldisericaceae bacterium]